MEPITLWRFDDAPAEYRELSRHGGDEDWIARIPYGYDLDDLYWLERGIGVCDTSTHLLEGGGAILIGAHA